MMTQYYNDEGKVFLERQTDEVSAGKIVYGAKEVLKCYVDETRQVIKTTTNEVVYSNASYYTETKIKENDLINGQPVLKVDNFNGFGRKYYRAYI